MELTLRQALKSRKVRNINGYYPYEHLVNTIRSIFRLQLNYPINNLASDVFDFYNNKDNYSLLDKEQQGDKLHPKMVADPYLLESILNPVHYPVFVVNKHLCESLSQTCSIEKNIVVSHPFVEKGILLMPHGFANTAIYVFRYFKRQDGSDIHFCALDKKIGFRSPGSIKMGENNKGFLFNLFLYKEFVENTATEAELLTPQSRGFGSAKNTNQKQIITPRMIGADYKPKTIRQESTGTHASPTTHWRSGHWRQQLIGKKENPDHKTIWIEPVLVNG